MEPSGDDVMLSTNTAHAAADALAEDFEIIHSVVLRRPPSRARCIDKSDHAKVGGEGAAPSPAVLFFL